MFQTKFIDDCIGCDYVAGVFVDVLLFPLTCVFTDTSKVVNFKVCLCTSAFLNYCHVEY